MTKLPGIILVLVVLTAALRIEFLFYLIYLCIGIYIWGRWVTPWSLGRLRIERDFTDHIFLGETSDVTLRIKNESWLPLPWLELVEGSSIDLRGRQATNEALSLSGGEEVDFRYTVRATRRGHYRIGPLYLSSGDLFGFFDEQRRKHHADYITVYPRINALDHLGLRSRLPFGTIASRQRLFEDPTRPAGVREFRSGDSIRGINWKVSGHSGTLMVKTFQPAISLDSMILLNLNQDDYGERSWRGATEWAIELAASFAAHLVERRQAVGLTTNGIGLLRETAGETPGLAMPPAIPPRAGRGNLMKILERLARIEAGKSAPFAQWTGPACHSLGWGMSILVITGSADGETCNALHRLVRAGFNPILFVVERGPSFANVRERARRLGFSAYEVTERADLAQWRRRPQIAS
jgi:uncharacterized protein (DUF58 family)